MLRQTEQLGIFIYSTTLRPTKQRKHLLIIRTHVCFTASSAKKQLLLLVIQYYKKNTLLTHLQNSVSTNAITRQQQRLRDSNNQKNKHMSSSCGISHNTPKGSNVITTCEENQKCTTPKSTRYNTSAKERKSNES